MRATFYTVSRRFAAASQGPLVKSFSKPVTLDHAIDIRVASQPIHIRGALITPASPIHETP